MDCQVIYITLLLFFFFSNKCEKCLDKTSLWKGPQLHFKTALLLTFQNYFNLFLKYIQELGPKIIYNNSLFVKFEITVQITFLLPFTENIWYFFVPTHCRPKLPVVAGIIDYRLLSVPFYKVIHSFLLALRVFLPLSFKMVSCLLIIIFMSSVFSFVLSQIEALRILILCRHCNWNHT